MSVIFSLGAFWWKILKTGSDKTIQACWKGEAGGAYAPADFGPALTETKK